MRLHEQFRWVKQDAHFSFDLVSSLLIAIFGLSVIRACGAMTWIWVLSNWLSCTSICQSMSLRTDLLWEVSLVQAFELLNFQVSWQLLLSRFPSVSPFEHQLTFR